MMRRTRTAVSLLAALLLALVAGVAGATASYAAGRPTPGQAGNGKGGQVVPYSGVGGVTGTVEANPLNVRGGPGTGYNLHGTLAYGSSARIPCYEDGTTVTATWPNGQTYTTSVWDGIADGTGES